MPLLGSRGAASLTGFGGLAKLGYLLRNSLRFRASNNAKLTRTPGSASNRKTYTISAWVKFGESDSSIRTIFCAGDSSGSTATHLYIYASQIRFYFGGAGGPEWRATQLLRDPAAWYHIVAAVDTNQGTLDDKLKLYVNGTRVTSWVSQNSIGAIDTQINNTVAHALGSNAAANQYLYDGYMAEFNFIDGQQLTPSSFAKTDAVTSQWIPIKFGGAYGTNGFYLNFTDASAATAAAIGKDSSGNGNNYTPSGISVTTGTTYDSMTDVPTLTNATTANYATLNPINPPTGATTFTYSNGNLSLTTANGGSSPATESSSLSTIQFPTTGKFYAEMIIGTTFGSGSNAWPRFGVAGYGMGIGGYVNFGGSSYGTFTTGDTMMVAWDASTGYIWWGKNGTWLNSGNPVAGTGYISTFTYDSASAFVQATLYTNPSNTPSASVNFGQQPFAYTPPSGFRNLNTYNLP